MAIWARMTAADFKKTLLQTVGYYQGLALAYRGRVEAVVGSWGRPRYLCWPRALSLPQERLRLKLTPRKPERFMRRNLRTVDERA